MLLVLSCVGVTYKTGFRLDDWIYCTLYIHTIRDYRQYSAIAVLHTSQFTVAHAPEFSAFTSRLLATDLSQSHCHFKSHMESSLHRLIPFLPLFCSLPYPKTGLISIPLLTGSYSGRLASRNWSRLLCPFIILDTNHTEIRASIVKLACLLVLCLAMDVLLLHAYASRECV
jgi:hypothetical protein